MSMSRVERIDDKLVIYVRQRLGSGPKSIVYRGTFEDKIPVAVKEITYKDNGEVERDLKDTKNERERTIMRSIEPGRNQNIVGYYYSTIVGNSMYLALELCNGDLSKYVKEEHLVGTYPPLKVIKDISKAIKYLHEENIVHRDLKPENVYYIIRDGRIQRMVLGDFGYSKTTKENMYSVSGKFGTYGYIPFEVWDAIETEDTSFGKYMNRKSDVFAMGCLFFYTFTRGTHPFGNVHCQTNISKKNPPHLEQLENRFYALKHLLIEMLSHEPDKRPTAPQILQHPSLKEPQDVLNDMKNASDDFEIICKNDPSKNSYLESLDVYHGDAWFRTLPENLRKYLYEYKVNGKYQYRELARTVRGVLRTIRNVENHYREFPNEVREDLGSDPDGHLQLWMRTNPRLFMHVYCKMETLKTPIAPDDAITDGNSQFKTNSQNEHRDGRGDEDEDESGITFLNNFDDLEPERSSNSTRNRPRPTQQVEGMQELKLYGERRSGQSIEYGSLNPHQTYTVTSAAPMALPYTSSSNTRNPNTASSFSESSDSGNIQRMQELKLYNERRSAQSSEYDSFNPQQTDTVSSAAQKALPYTRSSNTRNPNTEPSFPESSVPVIHQPMAKHHFSKDVWMMMARQEIDEGKRTSIVNQIGQNYIFCVDISESMSLNGTWQQTTQFFVDFMNSLGSFKHIYPDAPVYVSLVTFGHDTRVVQRLTNDFKRVETAFSELRLGGPTQMYGGLAIAIATAGIPTSGKGNPKLIVITDGRVTDCTLYEGPDQVTNPSEESEAKSTILKFIESCKLQLAFHFVQVGNPDSEFIRLMADMTGGAVHGHGEGRSVLKEEVAQDRNPYYESNSRSLPPIGSRVRRNPVDWNYGNQDGDGPGTVIGHHKEAHIVWVEWDNGQSHNCYQYGNNGLYDVLLVDEKRKVSETGQIYVGCCVTKEEDGPSRSRNKLVGTVIKVLIGTKKVEVRWNNGERGTYSFGENDIFEVWPPNTDESNKTDIEDQSEREVEAHFLSEGSDIGTSRNKNTMSRGWPSEGHDHTSRSAETGQMSQQTTSPSASLSTSTRQKRNKNLNPGKPKK